MNANFGLILNYSYTPNASSGIIWTDVLLMDEVLPEAGLHEFTFEVAYNRQLSLYGFMLFNCGRLLH